MVYVDVYMIKYNIIFKVHNISVFKLNVFINWIENVLSIEEYYLISLIQGQHCITCILLNLMVKMIIHNNAIIWIITNSKCTCVY